MSNSTKSIATKWLEDNHLWVWDPFDSEDEVMLREFTVGRRPGEGAIIKEAGDVILRTRPSWRGHDQEFLDKNINGEELLFTFRHRVGRRR